MHISDIYPKTIIPGKLIISLHISYGKENYLNSTVFLQNLPSTKFVFNVKGFHFKIFDGYPGLDY